ncbi:MAG TPA: hypothetical protein VFQ18_10285 [Candidatus Acidoferrum sp.]|nr:hypothetical protein [Candidatus Acidoferrum sp.]
MRRLLFALAAVAALWSSACSSGGSNVQPPPPSGKYSLASLTGQYAFVTNGEVFTSGSIAPTPLARVGSFVADGKGNIAGGMEDINTGGTPSNAILISGGSYTVSPNGRGVLTLNFQGGTTVDFGIVLTSTSDGLLIDETSNSSQASTGSGNFILQQSAPFALNEVTGNYVFDFSGSDASQPNPLPESFIGEFTVDGAMGTIPTGFFDDNDNGTLTSGGMTPGAISQDPGDVPAFNNFGRGIATIATQNFVFYIVNSRQVRFLSTNKGMLSGDAVIQTNLPANVSNINGGFAFVLAGTTGAGGITRVGRFTASGSTVSNVLMDTNTAGQFTLTDSGSNASISLDPATGRGILTFTDPHFSNAPVTAVFYLSSASQGVIQETTQSSTGTFDVADGSIAAQSGSPFTSANISGTYAMNWSGLVVAGGSFPVEDEEDFLAQASVSNLALSGAADIFQFTSATLSPQFDLGVGGAISINGDGTSGGGRSTQNTMTVNLTGAKQINFVVYFVSPQFAFFANNTNSGTTRNVAGILKSQQ